MRKILVGYDGSDQAARALDFAIAIAAQRGGAEIHIAFVVQKPGGAPDPAPDEVMDSLKVAAREELLDAGRVVTKSLATPVIHLETGNPGEMLLELADRYQTRPRRPWHPPALSVREVARHGLFPLPQISKVSASYRSLRTLPDRDEDVEENEDEGYHDVDYVQPKFPRHYLSAHVRGEPKSPPR